MKFTRSAWLLYATVVAVALFALAFTLDAHAKGSSSQSKAGDGAGSVMNPDVAPRAIVWPTDRLWQGSDGRILVCPFDAEIAFRQWDAKECHNKDDKNKQARWITIQEYKIDGMILVGYEYRLVGSAGTTILISYHGPKPIVESPVVQPSAQITITAEKVVVQRRKK